jgi:hypothetical protein
MEGRPRPFALQRGDLLTGCHYLEGRVAPRTEEHTLHREYRKDEFDQELTLVT